MIKTEPIYWLNVSSDVNRTKNPQSYVNSISRIYRIRSADSEEESKNKREKKTKIKTKKKEAERTNRV